MRIKKKKLLKIKIPSNLKGYIFKKGYVSINGISLTVVNVTNNFFTISIIPETISKTNLSFLKKGDFVNDPLSMYLSDLLTVPVNLAGLPAISIPCGFDKKGLPIGLQLIGNVLEEHRILNVANIFEKDAEVMNSKPNIEI